MALTKIRHGALPSGSILQVVATTSTTAVNDAGDFNQAFGEISTTFRRAITPLFASSNLLLEAQFMMNQHTGSNTLVQQFKFYDVTNTSTQRVRFRIVSEFAVQWGGSSSINRIYATFLRLGDT